MERSNHLKRLYIAARYSRKPEMQELAKQLEEMGYDISSSWLQEPYDPNMLLTDITDEDNVRYAQQDYEDIVGSDIMVFFSEDPLIGTPRGGRHVEFGVALTLGVDIYVVGPKENIFQYLPDVKVVPDVASLLGVL